MAIHKRQFDGYRIYYFTGGGGVPAIDCFAGDDHIGTIYFHDVVPVPPNNVSPDGKISLRYALNQFHDVATTLRYEKPLFLRLHTPSRIGFIATEETEPVGEQEGDLDRDS